MKIKRFWPILVIIVVGAVPLLDLLNPGLPITHDGQDHVARIANFYKNLEEGNLIPRWAANLNWGYGHPILMFLYPFPSYIASILHFLGFSFVDATKLVFGFAFIASGIAMYIWIRNFLGEKPAVASAVLYMIVPYRFVDLYVRGAIGEHMAFIFPPLILYFLLKLSKQYSYWGILGGSISLAFLILSHNAISLMFVPLAFLYGVFLIALSKKRKSLVYYYTSILVLGFSLSAFFWIPAFFEGKYTLRDIVTSTDYASKLVPLQNFLYGEWNYGISGQFTVQIGIVHWLFVLISIPATVFLHKRKNKLWVLSAGTMLVFISSLYVMTFYSKPIWDAVTTLQKFQFPWRFLSITVFASSLLSAFVIYAFLRKLNILFIFSILLVLYLNKDYWHAKDFLIKDESFYTGVYRSTTDTGESSPIWSVRFMEKEARAPIETIAGDAVILNLERRTTYHKYSVNVQEKTRLRENTLYFPGWNVLVDKNSVPIEFQDPANRGLITFFVEKGSHTVEIIFKDTKLRIISNVISLLSILTIFLFSAAILWRKSRKQ